MRGDFGDLLLESDDTPPLRRSGGSAPPNSGEEVTGRLLGDADGDVGLDLLACNVGFGLDF